MLNAPINVVFFRCLCHCLFKNPGGETLRFYGFSPVCVASLCVGTSMGFYDFFPVGGPLCVWGLWDFTVFFAVCGAPVSGDFEILRFFTCVCGPCVWGLWDFTLFLPVCGAPVCMGTLRFYGFEILRDFEILRFSPVCGRCVGDFENFQKNPIGKNPGCGDLKWQ